MIKYMKMTSQHLDAVYEIECESFSVPWTKASFRHELEENKMAYYFAALENDMVVGYAGMWHVINEGHITNIAVKKTHRGKGIGDGLMNELVKLAEELEMIGITLEVRTGNTSAQELYKKHEFIEEGIRKEYYQDTGEDALVMWKYLSESGGEKWQEN